MNNSGKTPRARMACRAAPLLVCAAFALLPAMAAAVDFDVTLSERARQAEVAPSCAALRRKARALDTDASYRKGVCLLYGIGGKADANAGVALLRRAAEANHAEAQMALADHLQSGQAADLQEALNWYQCAQRNGDQRAAGRQLHLTQRIAAAAQAADPTLKVEPPPGTIVDPSPIELQKLYGAGYHCHRMGLGERWCHDTVD